MSNSELALKFFHDWDKGVENFSIQTSGSTGEPKTIVLERKWMIWSAEQTGKVIAPRQNERMYLCLPADKVGGMMMLCRSKVWGIKTLVSEASSNPLVGAVDADIISVTPMQLSHILSDKQSATHLKRFREVLIGGGDVSATLRKEIRAFGGDTIFRHSYGMTETYSHIALRTLNGGPEDPYFKCLEGISIEIGKDNCAVIYVPYFSTPLYTNDIIELSRNGEFRVLGRKDNIINSGGLKLQPERIENLIHEHLQPETGFIISSVLDEILGEKIVLLCEDDTEFKNEDFEFLKTYSKYAIPKQIVTRPSLPLNAGGKIDRIKCREILSRLLE